MNELGTSFFIQSSMQNYDDVCTYLKIPWHIYPRIKDQYPIIRTVENPLEEFTGKLHAILQWQNLKSTKVLVSKANLRGFSSPRLICKIDRFGAREAPRYSVHIQLTCLVSLPPRAFLSPLLLYPPFLLCSTLSSFFRFSVPFAPSPRCFGLPFSGRPRSVSFASPHEHTGARARLISSYLKYRRQNNGVSICAERDRSKFPRNYLSRHGARYNTITRCRPRTFALAKFFPGPAVEDADFEYDWNSDECVRVRSKLA